MNNRRKLIIALMWAYLPTPLGSFAQPKVSIRRIGFLGSETASGYARQLEAFHGGLKDLGYVEGRNLLVIYRWAGGVNERLPKLAAELLGEKVEILVTHGGPGVRAAHRVTTTVPIVIASLGSDPVSMGLVKSLARPGGNITGVFTLSEMLALKRLELVKDISPTARRVAFMVSPAAAGGEMAKGMNAAAKTLKLDLQLVQINSANEFEGAIVEMREGGVDAIIVYVAPFFNAHSDRIAALAARQRIPTLGDLNFAESGGLLGYGANVANNFRRAAYFIDRIFKGAKPADLPLEQPTAIELVVNLKTAKALGLTMPPEIMVRADRVIQ